MKLDRQLLMRVHTLLAAFFLPVGLLFLVTGVLLAFNIKADSKVTKLALAAPVASPTLPEAAKLVEAELVRNHLPVPRGEESMKTEKDGWSFQWNGTGSSVKWTVKNDEPTGELSVTENGLVRRAEQLHKSKGALAFKVFSAAWALGLLLLFASGTVMAIQVKALRQMTWIALALGTLSFVVLAWLS
jgi:hypothetical protein